MNALLQSTASVAPASGYTIDWSGSPSYYVPPTPQPRPSVRINDTPASTPHAPLADVRDEQDAKAAQRAIFQTRAMIEVSRRLSVLRQEALSEGEPISELSAIALYKFLQSLGITERPSLFLLENGSFQSVWRNDDKEQISLQFIGRDTVQYAMFAKRNNALMARTAGQDTAVDVRARITDHGCGHLIV